MMRMRPTRTPRTRQQVESYLRDLDNPLDPQILEELADDLLAPILKDKTRSKSARQEYTILSERQLKRRHDREVLFTCLPRGAQVRLGLTVEEE